MRKVFGFADNLVVFALEWAVWVMDISRFTLDILLKSIFAVKS